MTALVELRFARLVRDKLALQLDELSFVIISDSGFGPQRDQFFFLDGGTSINWGRKILLDSILKLRKVVVCEEFEAVVHVYVNALKFSKVTIDIWLSFPKKRHKNLLVQAQV